MTTRNMSVRDGYLVRWTAIVLGLFICANAGVSLNCCMWTCSCQNFSHMAWPYVFSIGMLFIKCSILVNSYSWQLFFQKKQDSLRKECSRKLRNVKHRNACVSTMYVRTETCKLEHDTTWRGPRIFLFHFDHWSCQILGLSPLLPWKF